MLRPPGFRKVMLWSSCAGPLIMGPAVPFFMAILLLALVWFYNAGANSSTAISSLSGGHLTSDKSQEASVMDAKYLS